MASWVLSPHVISFKLMDINSFVHGSVYQSHQLPLFQIVDENSALGQFMWIILMRKWTFSQSPCTNFSFTLRGCLLPKIKPLIQLCKALVAQVCTNQDPIPSHPNGWQWGQGGNRQGPLLCSGLLAVLGIKLSLARASKALCHGATAPPCGCLRISIFM